MDGATTNKMDWIKTEDLLPEEGKYILGRHNRGIWHDSTDQKNVNCVVVKLVKGISEKEREDMKNGIIPSKKEIGIKYDGDWNKPIYETSERWNIYKQEDERANNIVPYCWVILGPGHFFGQEITHWMPIPDVSDANAL